MNTKYLTEYKIISIKDMEVIILIERRMIKWFSLINLALKKYYKEKMKFMKILKIIKIKPMNLWMKTFNYFLMI
jgi:hypothetical protein